MQVLSGMSRLTAIADGMSVMDATKFRSPFDSRQR